MNKTLRPHQKIRRVGFHRSINRTLLIWFLMLTLFPMVVTSWLSYQRSSESIRLAAAQKLEQVAVSGSRFINNWFDYRFMDILQQADDPQTIALLDYLLEGWKQSGMLLPEYVKSYHWTQMVDQHAIVSITDVKGNITLINEKFCEISGYTHEELMGQNHRMLNSGYHNISFFDEMYRTIANGDVWNGEICNKAKDGHFYWVKSTIVLFKDKNNKPQSYIAIRTDITARKNPELAVKESKDRLELVMTNTGVGFWDWQMLIGGGG